MDIRKEANKVSITTIFGNVLLAVIKFVAGLISNSKAMISDAIHTLSDILSTFIAIVGVNIASKEEDNSHKYGHERFECIASIVLAMILFITGIELGINGIKDIVSGDYKDFTEPGVLAIIAAVVSIIGKELMYQYTIHVAKKIKSTALKADAWHHRSDAISSIGALIGIILARNGYLIFDSIASIIIAILICKVSIDIFMDATDKLVDKACDPLFEIELRELILKEKGVLGVDDLKTRIFGSKIYVDIEIAADGNETLKNTHKIAERVHDKIEKTYPEVKHCMVHVNPFEEGKK